MPGGVAQLGICPNYYGPFYQDPTGNESCQNAMPAGNFTIQWAHGNESNWTWEDWSQVELKANVKYLLTYNATAQLSAEEFIDATLNGSTMICCKNLGPDAFAICLNPLIAPGAQAGAQGQTGQQQTAPGQQTQAGPGQQQNGPQGQQQQSGPGQQPS